MTSTESSDGLQTASDVARLLRAELNVKRATRFLLSLITGSMVLLATLSSSAEPKQYQCEGTVHTLVALASRQIWSDVPVKLPPLSADTPKGAEGLAGAMAKAKVQARETTVRVDYAKMRCNEIPTKPLPNARPLTKISPVKIEILYHCRVRTTWHLGPKSGKVDKALDVPGENPSKAMGTAIMRVQEQVRVLLMPRDAKPTWSETDVTCT